MPIQHGSERGVSPLNQGWLGLSLSQKNLYWTPSIGVFSYKCPTLSLMWWKHDTLNENASNIFLEVMRKTNILYLNDVFISRHLLNYKRKIGEYY